MVLAHIAGVPLEETALTLGPAIAAGAGIATVRLRERLGGNQRPRSAAAGETPFSAAGNANVCSQRTRRKGGGDESLRGIQRHGGQMALATDRGKRSGAGQLE